MLTVDVNISVDNQRLPENSSLEKWARAAYLESANAELALSVVDGATIRQLNNRYRAKDSVTNVLSFPADELVEDDIRHIGDIILCDAVIENEAHAQEKNLESHWAHMVVHGMLHLQNYDHIDDEQAASMEALEIKILDELGYPDPYQFIDPLFDNAEEAKQAQ